jgi:hypothetical protein
VDAANAVLSQLRILHPVTVRAPLPLLRPARVPRCGPCDHAARARALHAELFAHLILGV